MTQIMTKYLTADRAIGQSFLNDRCQEWSLQTLDQGSGKQSADAVGIDLRAYGGFCADHPHPYVLLHFGQRTYCGVDDIDYGNRISSQSAHRL